MVAGDLRADLDVRVVGWSPHRGWRGSVPARHYGSRRTSPKRPRTEPGRRCRPARGPARARGKACRARCCCSPAVRRSSAGPGPSGAATAGTSSPGGTASGSAAPWPRRASRAGTRRRPAPRPRHAAESGRPSALPRPPRRTSPPPAPDRPPGRENGIDIPHGRLEGIVRRTLRSAPGALVVGDVPPPRPEFGDDPAPVPLSRELAIDIDHGDAGTAGVGDSQRRIVNLTMPVHVELVEDLLVFVMRLRSFRGCGR